MGLYSLPVSCLTWGDPVLRVYRLYGRAIVHVQEGSLKPISQDCYCQCPCPSGRPLPSHASAGDLQRPIDLAQFPVGSLFFSPWTWCTQGFVGALQKWSPQFFGDPVIKSHWPSKSDFLELPSPWARSQAGDLLTGFRTFITLKKLLWWWYSPVCGLPTWHV